MPISIDDYLINQTGIDWSAALASWSFILPPKFTLWMVNRIGDLVIVIADGSVHLLDVGAGQLAKVADDRDDFRRRIVDDDNANDWLAIPLVDKLVGAGLRLQSGQCYAFKTLPILGGDYIVENFRVLPVGDWLGCLGSIHEQLQDVPDGSNVVLDVVNWPESN